MNFRTKQILDQKSNYLKHPNFNSGTHISMPKEYNNAHQKSPKNKIGK